jgi:hypothetical protein
MNEARYPPACTIFYFESTKKLFTYHKLNNMKILKITFVLVFTIFTGTVNAQTITAPEPDFTYQISYVGANNSTIMLETQIPAAHRFGPLATYKMKGTSSRVRLKSGGATNFIVNLGDNSKDISGVVQVFKIKQKGDSRICEFNIGNPAGGPDYVPFTFKKYGKSSYLVTLSGNLAPGEYAMNIFLDDAKNICLFGVD